MGLDMFCTARKYIGGKYEHREITGTINIKEQGKDLIVLDDMSMVGEIIFDVAYWRKANQIHKWFVNNIQKGVDDCGEYYLSKDDIHALVSICKECLEFPARCEELLPPQAGFFFGSTAIDEDYQQDLQNTIDQLEAALNNPMFEDCSFYYSSSW